jgi:penicillin-binding protein 1C
MLKLAWWVKGIEALFGIFILIYLSAIITPLQVNIPYAITISGSDGKILHAFLSSDDKWRMKTTLHEINPNLLKAIIHKEDRYFYYHSGVNLFAILRAGVNNIKHQKKTSGASTITMQVARMLFPASRTYLNKLVESFRALQLEWNFSKNEILEMYLSLIPFGGNIEGVKAASVFYLDKQPDALSLAECVALCIIPNRPNSLRPGSNNPVIYRERNKWLQRFMKQHVFKPSLINDAMNEPVDMFRRSAPKQIPSLAYRLKQIHHGVANIHTTIQSAMQYKLQSLTYQYSKRMSLKGIYNASVIVVDNKSGNVLCYISSGNPDDAFHQGQVDGINAIRSPGSTLKPLVFGLSMDKGLITPMSVINDVPVNFMGYSPENFNTRFNGRVTAEFALSHSLNIPAVKLLNQMGLPTLTEALVVAGFGSVAKNKKKLGLSVALGGCGVTLQELTGLYTMLANQGLYKPLKFTPDSSQTDTIRILSRGAAYMITDILSKITRPDLPDHYESALRIPHIAWKTGTSYGRRDAWSIGYNTEFTVGVWMGNFNGEGVAELSGAAIATPLLFDVFNLINYNQTSNWFVPPDDLNLRLVCSETGYIPNTFCDKQVIDYYIPGVSSNNVCRHLKEYLVSADEKMSYCTACAPETGYKRKFYAEPDAEWLAFLKSEHIATELPPPHNAACTRVFNGFAPKIVSPNAESEYIIDLQSGDKLMLSCQTAADVQNVYWYINDVFYRSAAATDQLFFTPQLGRLKVSCSDDKGRNTNIYITVNAP